MFPRLWPYPLFIAVAVALADSLYGNPVAIIGGSDGTGPYAAFVHPTLNQASSPITNLPVSGTIVGVAINNSGQAIIGGGNGTGMYAAFIASDSNAAGPAVSNLLGTGQLNGVAINDVNRVLVSGPLNPHQMYAAFIDIQTNAAGSVISGLPSDINTFLNGSAINNVNQSLIVGAHQNVPYAAFINMTANEVETTISNLPPAGFGLIGAAINQNGLSLIGGRNSVAQTAYAAFIPVGASAASPQITTLPAGGPNPRIRGVSLNDSGIGLIGGVDTSNAAYAAYVDVATNQATPIANLPTASGSIIYGTAINEFGQGLIGGSDGTKAYAAFVDPLTNTASSPILNLPSSPGSFIHSVAMIQFPKLPTNGLTGNNLVFANYINANALQDVFYFIPSVLDGTYSQALQNAAPTRNAISLFAVDQNMLFLNRGLSNHLRNYRHFKQKQQSRISLREKKPSRKQNVAANFLAYSDVVGDSSWPVEFYDEEKRDYYSLPPKSSTQSVEEPKEKMSTIWFEAIGALVYQKEQHQTTAFQPAVGGGILAFDHSFYENTQVGGGVAYTFTDIGEDNHCGSSRIGQECVFIYTSASYEHLYFDLALWGSLFQIDQVRNIHMTGWDFSSSSKPSGWQLSPHLELGYDSANWAKPGVWFIVDPFLMLDWVNAWQGSYHETGLSPFNAGQKKHYSSLLRSEVGIRLYEPIAFDSFNILFEEKVSYVNKTPFGIGKVQAFLVGSPGFFTVETLTGEQNLVAAEFSLIFEPVSLVYPYWSLSYQGEFNGSFQSHQLIFELSWGF